MSKLIVTPRGVAQFPRINTPDEYKNQVKYKTRLVLDDNDPAVQELIKRLTEMAEAHWADPEVQAEMKPQVRKQMALNPVFQEEYDENETLTGNVIMSFSCKASYTDSKGRVVDLAPTLFDAKGKRVDRSRVVVRGGSTIKVAFQPVPYAMAATKLYGVSLRLKSVQILELSEGGSNPFGEEEGFSYDEDDFESSDSAFGGNTSGEDGTEDGTEDGSGDDADF